MKKIYIAGPYSKGDTAINVKNAIDTANVLADLGYAPYVPHFTHFWHMIYPRPYDFWLNLDFQFLACCDGLLRIPGESIGADLEIEFAKENKIEIFYSVQEMQIFFETK